MGGVGDALGKLIGPITGASQMEEANEQNAQMAQERAAEILRLLSPAHINELYRTFLPQIMQGYVQSGQTATQGLRTRMAQAGLETSPYGAQAERGFVGSMRNQALQSAFGNAMNLASQQAGGVGGVPLPQMQATPGLFQQMLPLAQIAFPAMALAGVGQQQAAGTPMPFQLPSATATSTRQPNYQFTNPSAYMPWGY